MLWKIKFMAEMGWDDYIDQLVQNNYDFIENKLKDIDLEIYYSTKILAIRYDFYENFRNFKKFF